MLPWRGGRGGEGGGDGGAAKIGVQPKIEGGVVRGRLWVVLAAAGSNRSQGERARGRLLPMGRGRPWF